MTWYAFVREIPDGFEVIVRQHYHKAYYADSKHDRFMHAYDRAVEIESGAEPNVSGEPVGIAYGELRPTKGG